MRPKHCLRKSPRMETGYQDHGQQFPPDTAYGPFCPSAGNARFIPLQSAVTPCPFSLHYDLASHTIKDWGKNLLGKKCHHFPTLNF